MRLFHCFTLILLASFVLSACSSTDSFLDLDIADPSPMALAKPIIPGYNTAEEEPIGEEDALESPQSPIVQEEEEPSVLPPLHKEEESSVAAQTKTETPTTEPSAPKEVNTSTTAATPGRQTDLSPSRRVPSITGSDPCNEVHQAMISSMQREIEDLQTYYDDITDIIERHSIMKEVREKKKDLQKYKRDHGCK